MAAPHEPKGWNWNPAVITLLLVIAALIASGSFYLGYERAVREQMQQQINQAAQDAIKAKERETYNAGVLDSHQPAANKPAKKGK